MPAALPLTRLALPRRFASIWTTPASPHVLYNPRLVFGLGASKMEESCLTHEEVTKSTRYIKCKVAFDQIVDGKMKECRRDYAGFEAQMIQHMIDHCQGKLV